MLKRSRFIPSNYFIALMILICAAGCGGSGGSNSLDQTPIARPPTVTLTSSTEVIELGESFTLNCQPLVQPLVKPPLAGMETEVILVLNQCHPIQLGPIDTF